jgi:hypothetical protein
MKTPPPQQSQIRSAPGPTAAATPPLPPHQLHHVQAQLSQLPAMVLHSEPRVRSALLATTHALLALLSFPRLPRHVAWAGDPRLTMMPGAADVPARIAAREPSSLGSASSAGPSLGSGSAPSKPAASGSGSGSAPGSAPGSVPGSARPLGAPSASVAAASLDDIVTTIEAMMSKKSGRLAAALVTAVLGASLGWIERVGGVPEGLSGEGGEEKKKKKLYLLLDCSSLSLSLCHSVTNTHTHTHQPIMYY